MDGTPTQCNSLSTPRTSSKPAAPARASARSSLGCSSSWVRLFTVFMLAETWKQIEPWLWPATDCTILSSGVTETGDDEDAYRPLVRYRYEFDGQIRESDRFLRSGGDTASFDNARDRAARYQPGDAATCRVDSNHPALAVLERSIPWIGLVVFFPLIFVAIGGGGLWATWVGFSSRRKRGRVDLSKGVLGTRPEVHGRLRSPLHRHWRRCLRADGPGALDSTRPHRQPGGRLPCTIVSSSMRSWSTDDGTSYRADVLYEYQVGDRSLAIQPGRVLRLSQHRLRRCARNSRPIPRSSSSATCWVNPRVPSKSVLERQFRPKHLLGLIPLVFILAGWAVANSRVEADAGAEGRRRNHNGGSVRDRQSAIPQTSGRAGGQGRRLSLLRALLERHRFDLCVAGLEGLGTGEPRLVPDHLPGSFCPRRAGLLRLRRALSPRPRQPPPSTDPDARPTPSRRRAAARVAICRPCPAVSPVCASSSRAARRQPTNAAPTPSPNARSSRPLTSSTRRTTGRSLRARSS